MKIITAIKDLNGSYFNVSEIGEWFKWNQETLKWEEFLPPLPGPQFDEGLFYSLPVRVQNAINAVGIVTIQDLCLYHPSEFAALGGWGQKSTETLKAWCQNNNVKMQQVYSRNRALALQRMQRGTGNA